MKNKELKEEIQHIHNRINSIGDALIYFCKDMEKFDTRLKALETKVEELRLDFADDQVSSIGETIDEVFGLEKRLKTLEERLGGYKIVNKSYLSGLTDRFIDYYVIERIKEENND